MPRLKLDPAEINAIFPIRGVTFYKHALVLHRCSNQENYWTAARGMRKQITQVSQRSLNKLVLTVGATDVQFYSLLTLTYGVNFPLNGKIAKDQMNKFLTYMKRSFGGFEYFWFLEFQRRGAPHFHLVTSLPGPGRCERELMATIWSEIVEPQNWHYTGISSPYGRQRGVMGMLTRDSVFRQHRRESVWEALRSKDGAVRYALKYALKSNQKSVPKEYRDVGRFWATSNAVRLKVGEEMPVTEEEARQLIFLLGRQMERWEVLPKIIFHGGNLP